jgi:hypothetical protein
MNTPQKPDSVEPALRKAEADLARHLEEACEDIEQKDLSQESMDELLRLEDELLAAARAAAEAARLRRQLGERPAAERPPAERPPDSAAEATRAAEPAPAPAPDAESVYRVREFKGSGGEEWRVWQVRPGSSGRAANPERYLGEYVQGWLAFELLQGDVRKRLPGFPADWLSMSDTDLARLLPQAVDVPRRKPRDDSAKPP